MPKRVYFAFHYQDVVDFRANVVRKHNFAEGAEEAGYYDYSIWEEAKKNSPAALKRLIEAELQNTSATVVLVGSDTWARRWVRYEIFQSLKRGNSVLGIHINGVRGKDQQTKALGPNPFNNLALQFNPEGTMATATEWKDGAWRLSADFGPYSLKSQPHPLKGQHISLTKWCPIYDWIADDGYNNFTSWIGN